MLAITIIVASAIIFIFLTTTTSSSSDKGDKQDVFFSQLSKMHRSEHEELLGRIQEILPKVQPGKNDEEPRKERRKTYEEIGRPLGVDKVTHHGYHRFYPRQLEEFRDREFNMLEIGMGKGKSVPLWHEYFPKAHLYGLDRGDHDARDGVKDQPITMFWGSQDDPQLLRKIIESVPDGFAVIVDDASHLVEHQLATWKILFDRALLPGGVYIIEDIEGSYADRGSFYGPSNHHGLLVPGSTIEVFKGMIDVVNREFHNLNYTHANWVDHQILSLEFVYNAILMRKVGSESDGHINRVYRFRQHNSKYNAVLPPRRSGG